MKKYPLMQAQLGVFAVCMNYPKSTCYNCPIYIKLPDSTDMERLRHAWERLIEAHPIYKNRFEITEDGEICQYSDPDMEIEIALRSCTYTELEEYISDGFIRPFDLLSGEPLVRVELVETESGKYQLYDMSHTITDATSQIDLIQKHELDVLYRGGEPLPEEQTIYEAAERERGSLYSEDYEKARDYYRTTFEDYDFPTISNSEMQKPGRLIREIGFIDSRPIDEWCRENGVKVSHFFRAAYVYTMQLLTWQTELGYYSSHSGRDEYTRKTYGMFVKTVPMMDSIAGDMTAVEAVRSMRAEKPLHLSAYPFTHFFEEFRKRPLLAFNFVGMEAYSNYMILDGQKCPYVFSLSRDSDEELCVNIYLLDDEYEIWVDSGEGINDRRTVRMICDSMTSLIEQMLENPDSSMKEFSLLSEKNREAIMELSAGEKMPYDEKMIWLDQFEQQLALHPDNLAVADRYSFLSYRELGAQSDMLASWLVHSGVTKGDFVAVKLPRIKEFITSVLAIHKAGAAYVPLDPAYPKERIEYMLSDCEAKVQIESLSFESGVMHVNGQTAGCFESGVMPDVGADDIAYMIYTSGSTGKPKGTVVSHGSLMHYTLFTQNAHGLTEEDRFANHSSFSFDAHIESIFPVLGIGASVHLMPEEIVTDPDGIAEYIEKNSISGSDFIPSIGKVLMENYNLNLRFVTLGGEEVADICADSYTVFNEYGPTECTNIICGYKLEKGRYYIKAPIGRPVPNSYCFVLDRNGNLLPDGAIGELCYAGPQVSKGYWNREDKTNEEFKTCPFVTGMMMYHTGDLVIRDEEGELVWLGRKDNQIKLRGFRIEMGEIESAAKRIPGIENVFADVKQIGRNDILILYYTSGKGRALDEKTLRDGMESSNLAPYMHPHAYVHLEEMPLLPNGKINRRNLPVPHIESGTEYVAPKTEKQKMIADAVKTVLGTEHETGLLDDFFELGGDSISAIRMSSLLRKKGIKLSVPDIMRYRIVRDLAEHCEETEQDSDGEDKNTAFEKSASYLEFKAAADEYTEYQSASSATRLEEAISKLSPEEMGENEWDREEFECIICDYAKRGETVSRLFPLTGMQEAMLLKHISEPESLAYRIVSVYETKESPSERELRRALDMLSERHEMLRASVAYENVSIYRQIITDRKLPLKVIELRPDVSCEEQIDNLQKELLGTAFDLQRSPLFSVVYAKGSEDNNYLLTLTHHIIQDGWGMEVVMRDFRHYLALAMKGENLDISHREDGRYERAVREIAAKDRSEALAYWEDLLEGYDTRAEIPSYSRTADEERSINELSVHLDAAQTDAFAKLCRESHATLSNGIEAAWGMVLCTYMMSRDVVFAKVVSGRDNTETDVSETAGLLINSVPVRFRYDSSTTARQAVEAMQKQAAESGRYDYCGLSEIMAVSELKRDLLSSIIAFENYDSGISNDAKSVSADLRIISEKGEAFGDICPAISQGNDGSLLVHVNFDSEKYSEEEIETVLEMFRTFAMGMTENPDVPLSELPRLSREERSRVALMSKGEELSYNRDETFIDLFVNAAQKNPDHIAVVDEHGSFTYAELDRISDAVAVRLTEDGVESGDFVAIKMGRVKEFAAALIAVMKAGAAYVPIDSEYPEDRINYMLDDSGAKIILTEASFANYAAPCGDSTPGCINRTAPKGKAYMIYTSGSTGKPKGSIMSHGALRAFLAWQKEVLGLGESSVNAEHTSFSFDGSVCDLICPLAFGGQVHILSEEQRRSIPDIHSYFKEHGITGMLLTTQIGMAMIEEYPDMDLDYLVIGGEKMTPVKKPDMRLINAYGPTEFTVISTFHELDGNEEGEIPIGRPVPNSWGFVCDADGHLLPAGVAGELCMMGEQMSDGYLNREEQTKESFVRLPEIEEATGSSAPVYRTGDIVRYNRNNEIEYIGRTDDRIKLRGFRVEPGEIESAAAGYEGILQCAVNFITAGKSQKLCLYYTAKKAIDSDAIRDYLSKQLAEYMVPSFFMQLEEMPLTGSGKVDKKALPNPDIAEYTEYAAPESETERLIAVAMERILHPDRKVGALDDFFELGGDSISAIRMSSLLRKDGIRLSVADVMQYRIVRELAKHTEEAEQDSGAEGRSAAYKETASYHEYKEAAEAHREDSNASTVTRLKEAISKLEPGDLGEGEWVKEEFERVIRDYASRDEIVSRIFPLTGMQEAMLLKHISEPESLAYRMVPAYEIKENPTEEELRRVLDLLAERHEMLRSSVVHEDVSIYRQVITDRRLPLTMIELKADEPEEEQMKALQEEILRTPIDLQQNPLFRVVFAKGHKGSNYIIVMTHHIIQDGWGMNLIMRDLRHYLACVMGGEKVVIRHDEDGRYERAVREIASKDRSEALAYWGKLLEGYDTRAEIPPYEKPSDEGSGANELSARIDSAQTDAFAKLCRDSHATLASGIEAAWGMVLCTYMMSRDVVFAKVVSGRNNTETDVSETAGLLINSVPVRFSYDGNTTARQAIEAMQKQAAESGRFDYCGLSEITRTLKKSRDMFPTVLVFENYGSGGEVKSDDETVSLKLLSDIGEAFDDICPATSLGTDGGLILNIGFNDGKYSREEIETILGLFRTFICGMVQNPDKALSDLPRMSEAEIKKVAHMSKGEELSYNRNETFIDLFVKAAQKNPDHIAVVDEQGYFTYGELNRISDTVAVRLTENGVESGDFVAIKMGRVKEFAAAVIAVMKAGAAYVPIDPEYPEERIRYMLEDSGARIILTEESFAKYAVTDGSAAAEAVNRAAPGGRAYMIYTSGSTGRPKGVVQRHRAIRAFLAWRRDLLKIGENSKHAHYCSFSFDASLDDLICPLAFGGQVHILSEEMRRSMPDMYSYFAGNGITGLTYPTRMGVTMTEEYPDMNLEFMMMGGETLINKNNTSYRIINGYGPTEFNVCSSYHVVGQDERGEIPIGRPVPNSWSFICDHDGHLLPPGLPGELCLMGEQVAEGYLNQKEITQKSFVKLPEIEEASGVSGTVYRTGDTARYNSNGELEYMGRTDEQIKLRGFRIELSEIEVTAQGCDGVESAAAAVWEYSGSQHLVLYYVSAEEMTVTEHTLREWMENSGLAEYMQPEFYMPLDEMPLSPNGKINRKALPDASIIFPVENVEPDTALEVHMLTAAREILKRDDFGVTDDLFMLGMTSLSVIRFVLRINMLGEHEKFRVSDVIHYRNIRELINGRRENYWAFSDYDSEKDWIVFLYGVVPVAKSLQMLEVWSEEYNIFVIESIDSHYDTLFAGNADFEEVIDVYTGILDENIPDGDRVAGFAGFSWGGTLSWHLAERWAELRGNYPFVFMGGSALIYQTEEFQKENTSNDDLEVMYPDNIFELTGGKITKYETVRKMSLSRKLDNTVKRIPTYKGKILVLNPILHNDMDMMERNIRLMKSLAKDVEIIDYPNHAHDDLYYDQTQTAGYLELMIKADKEEADNEKNAED